MPSPEEITRHPENDHPDSDAWVEGFVQEPFHIEVVEYDAMAAAIRTRRGTGPATGMDYNRHKEPVVREGYARMFRAHGLLPDG